MSSNLSEVFNVTFNKKFIKTLMFLDRICKGRDPSHGYEHGVTVFQSALKMYLYDARARIYNIPFSTKTIELIIIGGLLHDVNDDKYKLDEKNLILTNSLTDFLLDTNDDDTTCLIMNIIENVSWNKEMFKRKKLDVHQYWLRLLGIEGYIALMYVMTADRIESLYAGGHIRSQDYNTKHSLKPGEGEKELYEYVNKVVKDKLSRLDEFCYTPTGKVLAIRGREVLCRVHEEWRKKLFGL